MRAATQGDFVSAQDYLAAEAVSDIRHEYLGGLVYALAGETRGHSQIAQNFLFNLRQQLKGGPCKLYMHDIRVNFDLRKDEYYYYADIVDHLQRRLILGLGKRVIGTNPCYLYKTSAVTGVCGQHFGESFAVESG